jgi:hypothetical protein
MSRSTSPDRDRPHKRRPRRRTLILAAVAAEVVVPRLFGSRTGRNVVVRCSQGHLFATVWIPFASVKSIRLGPWRYQRCPVGKHWALVTQVKESDLTEEEIRIAEERKDTWLP